MKKKYGIAILSVLIIVVSTILLINKPSYAGMIPDGCPNNITVEESEDTLSLIKTDYLTITLPKNIEIKDTKEDTLALLPIEIQEWSIKCTSQYLVLISI